MKYRYITIEREYGSGAREIGHRLSEKTGISCYGTEILAMAAGKMQMSESQARSLEEKSVGSLLYTIEMMAKVNNGAAEHAPDSVRLYSYEQQIIRNLAGCGPAIFIGRCAGNALRDYQGVLRVYVHADPQVRLARIVDEYGIAPGNAESYMKQTDKRRANFYFSNTGHKWTEFRQYNLVLDSSELGILNCVDLIESLMQK